MKSPFVFGKIAEGKSFINREKEVEKLKINFFSGINSMLISPRRWGKSSLVRKVAKECIKENESIRICFIDLFRIKTEQELYEAFTKEILKQSASKWEEWVQHGKEFLKSFVPSFSLGIDPQTDFSIKLNWNEVKSNAEHILNLPEQIARKRNLQFVICIDEFQKIAQFEDSLNIQQQLRSVWQHQQKTAYCIYGSKRHIITELFQNQSMPFYKFGDVMYLKKIEKEYWYTYIIKKFNSTKKKIPMNIVRKIVDIVENHPYHIQQLAHQIWINTDNLVTDKVFDESLEELIKYNSIMYIREIDNLTPLQINFLLTVANKEKLYTSKEVINKYKLETAGNISRLKSSLENKELVDFFDKEPCFIDPLFELWFKNTFAK